MTFCHLNIHTDRSILRGLIKPNQLAIWSKMNGVRAAAITDYGGISGAVELYSACKKVGIIPIYGMEVTLAKDKAAKVQGGEQVILLAKNRTGMDNLIKLATLSAMYFYYVPRLDFMALADHSDGLIVLTGDLKGIAAGPFFAKQQDGLAEVYDEYTTAFGENFYFELHATPTESQRIYNEGIFQFCSKYGAKVIATGNCHYMSLADKALHRRVMAIKNSRNPGWVYPFKGDNHVSTREEMEEYFYELHQETPVDNPILAKAFDAPDEIINMIEPFDLKSGVKIPSYQP